MAKFKPGQKPPPGSSRKPGSRNTMSMEVKRAIQLVFKGMGGVPGMLKWARRNPSLFYTKIYVKLLPQQLKVDASEMMEPLNVLSDALGAMTSTELKELQELLSVAKAQEGKRETKSKRTDASSIKTNKGGSHTVH